MRSPVYGTSCRVGACFFAAAICVSFASPVFAEAPCLASSESPGSETRPEPLKIKLSGFINTKPEASSLGFVKLGINAYHTMSYFEVIVAEAPDCPYVTHHMILQQTPEHEIDFHLLGPKALLLKVATAEPGTPLALTGFFQPRSRTLQLLAVDVIGTSN